MPSQLVNVPASGWVLLSSAAVGTVENPDDANAETLVVRFANSLPPASERWGHKIAIGQRESWSRQVAMPVYGRRSNSAGDVVVTEG